MTPFLHFVRFVLRDVPVEGRRGKDALSEFVVKTAEERHAELRAANDRIQVIERERADAADELDRARQTNQQLSATVARTEAGSPETP